MTELKDKFKRIDAEKIVLLTLLVWILWQFKLVYVFLHINLLDSRDTISEIRFGSRRYVLDLVYMFSFLRSNLKSTCYFFLIFGICHLLIHDSDY